MLSSITPLPTTHRPHFRIVNLVIYTHLSDHERMMRRELERLTHPDVKRMFISLSPDCGAVHERDGTLCVPGTESFIPGILHKTIEALSFCSRTLTFDFLVRSNVSTVIDFQKMLEILPRPSESVIYASTYVWEPDVPERAYASGTNIVMSSSAVAYVLSERHELRMDIIDDVALGMLLRRVTMPLQLEPPMVWDDASDASSAGVVFRNRSADRMRDAKQMADIIDRIVGMPRAADVTPLTRTT